MKSPAAPFSCACRALTLHARRCSERAAENLDPKARRPATRRIRATAGLVDAEQLPKFLAGRNSFIRQFASSKKVSLEFLAKLGVLPLFLDIGFAAAPGWWLVIFSSHSSAFLVHKNGYAEKFRTPFSRQREPSGSVPD